MKRALKFSMIALAMASSAGFAGTAFARHGADDPAGHVRQEDRRADRQQDRRADRREDRAMGTLAAGTSARREDRQAGRREDRRNDRRADRQEDRRNP